MKIPKTIKMGGHKIKVRQVDENELSNTGDFHGWPQIIRIGVSGTTESGQAETLLHEILEAAKFKYNLDLDHKDLTIISEVLFAVIRDNKIDFR